MFFDGIGGHEVVGQKHAIHTGQSGDDRQANEVCQFFVCETPPSKVDAETQLSSNCL